MADKYLITFTPLDRFFFGSSRSFSEGFYVVSMKYPQPTTILGCLRHTILMQNDKTKVENGRVIPDITSDGAKSLTGTSKMEGLDETDDYFGIIERVSPVFIVKHTHAGEGVDDILFPAPVDIEKNNSNIRILGYIKKENGISYYSGRKKNHIISSEKNPKKYSLSYLGGEQFWREYCGNSERITYHPDQEEGKVILEGMSVGIGREENRVVKEGMYYTKKDLTLKNGYSFGIVAWLKEADKLRDGVVILGGERSAFRLKIKSIPAAPSGVFASHPVVKTILNEETDFTTVFTGISNKEKIVLLSPLICDKDVLETFEYARISGINNMRVWSRYKGAARDKSEAACLVPAGSVFYCAGKENGSENYRVLAKIGYNQALKIESNKGG